MISRYTFFRKKKARVINQIVSMCWKKMVSNAPKLKPISPTPIESGMRVRKKIFVDGDIGLAMCNMNLEKILQSIRIICI